MNNAEIFENYMNEKEIHFERGTTDDDCVFFRMSQNIKNGGTALIVVLFNKNQQIVDLNVFQVASVTDPLKKEPLFKLLNELNKSYRFSTFTEREGEVSVGYSYQVHDNSLDGEEVLDMLIMLFQTAEDNYPKFMKLQWN